MVRPSSLPRAFLLILLLTWDPLWGKDFPQPLPDTQGELPLIGGMFLWEQSFHSDTQWDSFLFRTASWGTLAGGPYGFLQYFFDSALLAGPLSPGENPAAVVGFWLNAVQFEYGLRGTFPFSVDHQVYGEYSRRSLHPLRPGYAQTSYDVLALGAEIKILGGPMEAALHPRLSWLQMFPFWQSVLPTYRELIRGEIGWDAAVPGPGSLKWFAGGRKSLLYTRSGTFGWEVYADAGLRLEGPQGRGELYGRLFFSDDTELLEKSPHRDFQAGAGLRFFR